METKYLFQCGCEYSILEIQTGKLKRADKFVCPIHDVFLQGVTFTCLQCGERFVGKTKKARFCKECQEINHQEYSKNYWLKYVKPNQQIKPRTEKKTPTRKINCENYSACLTMPSGKLLKNPAACLNCIDYVKRDTSNDIIKHMRSGRSGFVCKSFSFNGS